MWSDTQLHITAATGLLQPVVAPVQNRQFIKPLYGLWTSTYADESSAWVDWCLAEDFGNPHACSWWVLQPDPSSRVYVIDSAADLCVLCERYPDPTMAGLGTLAFLDFERIARDYDGLHLTESGQWATRHSRPSLYGWDCECTLWFRWCFDTPARAQDAAEHGEG